MRGDRSIGRWLLVVALALAGCAKTVDGAGDETHFQHCEEDRDCVNLGPGHTCVDQQCRPSDSAGSGGACPDARCFAETGGDTGDARTLPITGFDGPTTGTTRCDDGTVATGVWAADYDQSCTRDQDCVAVGEGDGCPSCAFACPLTSINRKDQAAFDAAVARTPGGKLISSSICGCPMGFATCCRNNRCVMDPSCPGP